MNQLVNERVVVAGIILGSKIYTSNCLFLLLQRTKIEIGIKTKY